MSVTRPVAGPITGTTVADVSGKFGYDFGTEFPFSGWSSGASIDTAYDAEESGTLWTGRELDGAGAPQGTNPGVGNDVGTWSNLLPTIAHWVTLNAAAGDFAYQVDPLSGAKVIHAADATSSWWTQAEIGGQWGMTNGTQIIAMSYLALDAPLSTGLLWNKILAQVTTTATNEIRYVANSAAANVDTGIQVDVEYWFSLIIVWEDGTPEKCRIYVGRPGTELSLTPVVAEFEPASIADFPPNGYDRDDGRDLLTDAHNVGGNSAGGSVHRMVLDQGEVPSDDDLKRLHVWLTSKLTAQLFPTTNDRLFRLGDTGDKDAGWAVAAGSIVAGTATLNALAVASVVTTLAILPSTEYIVTWANGTNGVDDVTVALGGASVGVLATTNTATITTPATLIDSDLGFISIFGASVITFTGPVLVRET